MSRIRQSATPALSLFPFLAVLVSAMGALILLLVVITNKIKEDTLLAAVVKTDRETTPKEPVSLPAVDIAMLVIPEQCAPPEKVNPQYVLEVPYSAQELKSIHQMLDAKSLNTQQQQTRELQQQKEAIYKELNSKAAELKRLNENYNAYLAKGEQEQNRHQALVLSLNKKNDEKQQLKKMLQSLETENVQLSKKLENLDDQSKRKQALFQRLKAEVAARSSQYQLVPFEGLSGTTRRPIYIECTASGIYFRPEDIRLVEKDFIKANIRTNPLRKGVDFLNRYWINYDQKRNPGDPREPYVLVVVRPSGIPAFYLARRMLADVKIPYGYELIDENVSLTFAEQNPEATKQLIAALNLQSGGSGGGAFPGMDATGDDLRKRLSGITDSSSSNNNGEQTRKDPRWNSKDDTGFSGGKLLSQKQGLTGNEGFVYPPAPDQPIMNSPGNTGDSTTDKLATQFTVNSPPSSSRMNSAQGKNKNGGNPTGKPGDDLQNNQQAFSPLTKPDFAVDRPTYQKLSKTWGKRGGNLIGLEEVLIVNFSGDKIACGKQVLDVGVGETRESLQQNVESLIVKELTAWGAPPQGFRWIPRVKCQITPGGNYHYERVNDYLKNQGMTVVAEQVLESRTQSVIK